MAKLRGVMLARASGWSEGEEEIQKFGFYHPSRLEYAFQSGPDEHRGAARACDRSVAHQADTDDDRQTQELRVSRAEARQGPLKYCLDLPAWIYERAVHEFWRESS